MSVMDIHWDTNGMDIFFKNMSVMDIHWDINGRKESPSSLHQ